MRLRIHIVIAIVLAFFAGYCAPCSHARGLSRASNDDGLLETSVTRKENSQMGAFNINITGVGGHGCERKAKPGEKLHGRCGRFNCPDCLTYDFVQRLRQSGMVRDGDGAYSVALAEDAAAPHGREVFTSGGGERFYMEPMKAEFTHWPGQRGQVVDDMLKNERKSGQF